MESIDFIKVLALTFVALFPVVNPIGGAPIFLSLTKRLLTFVPKSLGW
jgi:small neutral amino acid transporter SnatA (MarC family)